MGGELRGALAAVHCDVTDEPLDKGTAEKRLPNDRKVLRQFYAWVDPEADPDTKSAYRFGHHFVDESGKVGAAAYRTCVVGIAELNGARGGTTIPEADKRGVWNHLAAHIKDFGKEPPELKAFPVGLVERRVTGRSMGDYIVPTFELRVTGDGQPVIEGHAAVFDQWSEDLGGFREIIRAGTFKKTIQEADIRALFNHDPNYVMGRNMADTLTLAEDDQGLAVTITPPDTTWARDLEVSMRRGDITQMSFGFRTIRDRWGNEDGFTARELLEVRLFDVSVVTFPAYPQTDAVFRAAMLEMMARYGLAAPSLEGHAADDDEPGEPGRASHSIARLRRELQIAELEV